MRNVSGEYFDGQYSYRPTIIFRYLSNYTLVNMVKKKRRESVIVVYLSVNTITLKLSYITVKMLSWLYYENENELVFVCLFFDVFAVVFVCLCVCFSCRLTRYGLSQMINSLGVLCEFVLQMSTSSSRGCVSVVPGKGNTNWTT